MKKIFFYARSAYFCRERSKLLVLLLLPLALLAACGGEAQNGGANLSDSKPAEIQTVKIGIITPLSGDVAALGQEIEKSMDFELPRLNQQYASKGYRFELVPEDGKCNGGDAVTAFNKLTDVNGVKYILGGACSSESLGIAPLLADNQVLAVSGTSSSPEIEGKSPYLFSFSYDDAATGRGIAEVLGKYNKVAMISEQNDYNQAIRTTVQNSLTSDYPNVQVVADEQFTKGGTDFRNQLQKLKAANPDVIFLNSNVGVTSESLVKQLAELKDWKVDKVGTFALMGAKVLAISPETLEGTVIIDAPKVNTPEFKALFDQIVKEKGSLDNIGNYYTASNLDSFDVLAQVIVESGNNPEVARDLLAKGTFNGHIGTITFNGKTFVQGIGMAKFVIKNGKVELMN